MGHRIPYSSSLHEGYDEPEILLNQIVKSVPKALTLDSARTFCHVTRASDMAHAVNTRCAVVYADAHSAAY